jgi:hypothetical protein
VQYLIMNVLSKQGVSEGEVERVRSEWRSTKRIWRLNVSVVSPSSSTELVERCGRTLLEDMNNLLHELSTYFTALVRQGKESKAKRLRSKSNLKFTLVDIPLLRSPSPTNLPFLDAWGSLVDERSSSTGDKSKHLKVSTRLARRFSRLSKSAPQHREVTTDLLKVLGKVRKEVLLEYQSLKELGGPTEILSMKEKDLVELKKRKRLLCLFVKDLSSRASGEVVSSKSQRDSQISGGLVGRVSWELKWMAGLLVGLMDVGMLFYVYLFAMNQTRSRQHAWFLSFLMWLGFEIFVSSTALVLVLHLLIPLYVWSEVSEVKQKVLRDLMTFREKYLQRNEKDIETGMMAGMREGVGVRDSDEEFNAAKYLFPSWRVASMFPGLPESKLILQFSTPWPMKKFGEAEGNVAKEYEDDVISSTVEQILWYFLASLLRYSSLLQDIVVQTMCNGGLGYLCVLLVQLWNFNPWLTGVAVCLSLLCVYGLGKLSLSDLAQKLKEEEEATPRPGSPGDGAPRQSLPSPGKSEETKTPHPHTVLATEAPRTEVRPPIGSGSDLISSQGLPSIDELVSHSSESDSSNDNSICSGSSSESGSSISSGSGSSISSFDSQGEGEEEREEMMS